jgi:hypothetical protein
MEQVPRWIPALRSARQSSAAPFSWRETIYSERGTIIAIGVGYALLAIKARLSLLA